MGTRMSSFDRLAVRAAAPALLLAGLCWPGPAGPQTVDGPEDPPALLRDTGLYEDAPARRVSAHLLAFAPQYPLWTDGATKRRWLALPPGQRIDASDPDDWRFPVGTRVWKEFSFAGRPVETRFMQRLPDGSWRYATYAWRADGAEADLVGPSGRRKAYPLGDGLFHAIPSRADCKACHEGRESRVLGFSALQLSPDRDAGAPHAEALPAGAVDLASLVAAGLLETARGQAVPAAPRAPGEGVTRAATGYLHGNCGHCHNRTGPLASLGLDFWQPVGSPAAHPAAGTTAGVAAIRLGSAGVLRLAPGQPEASLLLQRAGSRQPVLQMPPLGTALVDRDALAVLAAWITAYAPPQRPEQTP